jgi:hypothetical protein
MEPHSEAKKISQKDVNFFTGHDWVRKRFRFVVFKKGMVRVKERRIR